MRRPLRKNVPPCHRCNGNGFYTWERDGERYWDVCECPAGEALSAAIRQGENDIIRSGRLHKWSDIRRD